MAYVCTLFANRTEFNSNALPIITANIYYYVVIESKNCGVSVCPRKVPI